MTAATRTKFLFDTDFDDELEIEAERHAQADLKSVEDEASYGDDGADDISDEPAAPAEPEVQTFLQADLDAARQEGIAEGKAQALAETQASQEQRLTEAVTVLQGQITGLFQHYQADREQDTHDAVAVATVILRKLFPSLNDRHAQDEVETLIRDVLGRTRTLPKLTIRVAKELEDALVEKAEILRLEAGFEGEVQVLGDETYALSDCRADWPGGAIVRDQAEIWQAIDEIIERNLGGQPLQRDETPKDDEKSEDFPEESVEDVEIQSNLDDNEPKDDAQPEHSD